ncbi:MAG: hypothetical protein K2N34_12390 [Lachnospiraceae bacterium]|nr:hypothetical protein [Lachnospiraceae bacterium]
MKKELYNAIDKIETSEKRTSKSEVDKTYDLVMKKLNQKDLGSSENELKVSMDKDQGKNRKKRFIAGIVTITMTAAAVFGVFAASKSLVGNKPLDNTNPAANEQMMKKAKAQVFVFEAKSESQSLTGLYASEMVKREVAKGEKTNIGMYSPLMSSIPGYPLTVSSSNVTDDETSSATVKVTVDGGELLRWDIQTGKITPLGTEGSFRLGDNIFWSPLSDETVCKSAVIMVELYEEEQMIDRVKICMEEQESGLYYTAEKIE